MIKPAEALHILQVPSNRMMHFSLGGLRFGGLKSGMTIIIRQTLALRRRLSDGYRTSPPAITGIG
jgi:hypothetical protein